MDKGKIVVVERSVSVPITNVLPVVGLEEFKKGKKVSMLEVLSEEDEEECGEIECEPNPTSKLDVTVHEKVQMEVQEAASI